jgi:probable rRNA maturation factor
VSPRRTRLPEITIRITDSAWRELAAIQARIRKATGLTLRRAQPDREHALTILLMSDGAIRQLNSHYRGKDKPTNVLSFPAAGTPGYLGDIALAHGVTAKEANKSGKPVEDHAVHLAVHGVLHLLGYDHEAAADAATMEALEIEILAELGIGNPYEIRQRRRA